MQINRLEHDYIIIWDETAGNAAVRSLSEKARAFYGSGLVKGVEQEYPDGVLRTRLTNGATLYFDNLLDMDEAFCVLHDLVKAAGKEESDEQEL